MVRTVGRRRMNAALRGRVASPLHNSRGELGFQRSPALRAKLARFSLFSRAGRALDHEVHSLQRFTLTCGREERFLIAVSLLPRASIVHDN